MDDLAKASARFHSDIATRAHALDMLKEHVYVEEMGEVLTEAGEIDDCIRASYQAHGLRVDGYQFDEEFSTLNLLVAHWMDEPEPEKAHVTNTEIEAIFKRCTNFFQRSLQSLGDKIEIANEAHDLASLIHECRADIQTLKMILITDGIAARRPAEREERDGIEVIRVVWDIDRTMQFLQTGERETITVDFIEMMERPLPCIAHLDTNGRYTAYLAYVSGDTLASIYSQWGTKLLEMNVRVFLSARGKVNRGIRDTILNNPDLFCAYNNGITVLARSIELEDIQPGMRGIRKAMEFQVVNGGQTIASLYHSKKKGKADLSNISVQMKLITLTNEADIPVLVPKISEYSNTQNRVSMADMAANDPPHPELHEISKRLLAPDPTGGSRQTYWFYEKARGSYEETKRLEALTPAKVRAFEALYPNSQRFDKGLLGKAWNTYLQKPHHVSMGAQKNFADFNMWLREQDEDWSEFFKKTVALVMLWKRAEQIVRRQHFEGYRHNIVTYTLAWLFHLTDTRIDLDKIWLTQDIGEPILTAIDEMASLVNKHIRNTTQNITEWCKKEDCWNSLKEIECTLPPGIEEEYISRDAKARIFDPTIRAERETIDFCVDKGADPWFKLSRWLAERNFLTGKARSQCFNMGRYISRKREPSIALSLACKRAWEDAEVRGWSWNGK